MYTYWRFHGYRRFPPCIHASIYLCSQPAVTRVCTHKQPLARAGGEGNGKWGMFERNIYMQGAAVRAYIYVQVREARKAPYSRRHGCILYGCNSTQRCGDGAREETKIESTILKLVTPSKKSHNKTAPKKKNSRYSYDPTPSTPPSHPTHSPRSPSPSSSVSPSTLPRASSPAAAHFPHQVYSCALSGRKAWS